MVAENALGYAGYVVASMSQESGSSDSVNNLSNKRALQRYICHYPAGRYAVQFKLEARATVAAASSTSTQLSSSSQPSTSASSRPSTSSQAASPSHPSISPRSSSVPVSSLRSLLIGKGKSQQTINKSVKRLFSPQKFQPCKYATRKWILSNTEFLYAFIFLNVFYFGVILFQLFLLCPLLNPPQNLCWTQWRLDPQTASFCWPLKK